MSVSNIIMCGFTLKAVSKIRSLLFNKQKQKKSKIDFWLSCNTPGGTQKKYSFSKEDNYLSLYKNIP